MAQKTNIQKSNTFKCKCCGRCCLRYGHEMYATEKDIQLWRKEGRQDILEWVDMVTVGKGIVVSYDLWINQRTDEPAFRCPFLRKVRNKPCYTCRIYDVRPEVCRKYPVNEKHASENKCRGYKKR